MFEKTFYEEWLKAITEILKERATKVQHSIDENFGLQITQQHASVTVRAERLQIIFTYKDVPDWLQEEIEQHVRTLY